MNPQLPLDFKKLISARFLFSFGVQMQSVILGWGIYALLKDPLSLGLIGLVEAVPAIGLALYAGYLVDRMPPLLVYRRMLYASLFSGVILLTEHLYADQLTIFTQAGLLYFASFLTGLARAFSQPSIFAALPRMVPRDQLMRANAFGSSMMEVASISGPAFGGIAFGFLGGSISSGIVCVLLICAILAMLLIEKHIPATENRRQHASPKDELLSGLHFVLGHPILFPALTLDMVSVLFGGVTALLPIFASQILMVGPKGLGALRAAPAVGAALIGFYMTGRAPRKNAGTWLFVSVAGFGVCILIFGASTNFYISLAALAFSGAFDGVSMLIRSMAVQLSSPDDMRGKISAVNSIFIGSSNEIGEVESGIAAKLLGTIPAVYFGGVMCLLTVGIVALMAPGLRKMDIDKLKA